MLAICVDEPIAVRPEGQNRDSVRRGFPRPGRFGGRGLGRLNRVDLSDAPNEEAAAVLRHGERRAADRFRLLRHSFQQIPCLPAGIAGYDQRVVGSVREGVDFAGE